MSTVKRAAAFRVTFPMYETATGDLATGLSPAASVSKDGGNFAAVSDAPVEIQTSGVYELTLTSGEMTADAVVVKVTATGARAVTVHITTEALTNADVLTAPIADYETGASFRSLLGAVAKLVNRTKVNGVTQKLEVYQTDDSTLLAQQSLSRDASAEPVVEVNTD